MQRLFLENLEALTGTGNGVKLEESSWSQRVSSPSAFLLSLSGFFSLSLSLK
jgi:hypothetical protein